MIKEMRLSHMASLQQIQEITQNEMFPIGQVIEATVIFCQIQRLENNVAFEMIDNLFQTFDKDMCSSIMIKADS
jgi:hypothetical protein